MPSAFSSTSSPVSTLNSPGWAPSCSTLTENTYRYTVVETHPESLIDLRVHSPFTELVQYAATFDYSKMDSAEHSHVPAVVILIKAVQSWRDTVSSLASCLELVRMIG